MSSINHPPISTWYKRQQVMGPGHGTVLAAEMLIFSGEMDDFVWVTCDKEKTQMTPVWSGKRWWRIPTEQEDKGNREDE